MVLLVASSGGGNFCDDVTLRLKEEWNSEKLLSVSNMIYIQVYTPHPCLNRG